MNSSEYKKQKRKQRIKDQMRPFALFSGPHGLLSCLFRRVPQDLPTNGLDLQPDQLQFVWPLCHFRPCRKPYQARLPPLQSGLVRWSLVDRLCSVILRRRRMALAGIQPWKALECRQGPGRRVSLLEQAAALRPSSSCRRRWGTGIRLHLR